LSSNPYENEPGYETARGEEDKKNIKLYVAKIRHETLRISVVQRLEGYLGINPDGTIKPQAQSSGEGGIESNRDYHLDEAVPEFEPFKDLCKRRFLWYFESYMLTIASAKTTVENDQPFSNMPFESRDNGMDGKFRYDELEKRLRLIRKTLDTETENWATEGLVDIQKESGVAANLQRQFEQVLESYKRNDSVAIDVELVDKNPFVWQVTYFGRPMTNLDGGLFRIKISFSPRFPEELPRVKFETPMFHHRISKDGIVCYFPKREDDAKSHIDGIIVALEDESPPYDPRTMVNPEASKLFWGSSEDKKNYNRRLRRAVQRSVE
jgi:ubiquitin-conjugating enzyme E2 Z